MYNLPPIFIVFFLDLGLKKKQTLKVVKCCVIFTKLQGIIWQVMTYVFIKKRYTCSKKFYKCSKKVIEWSKMVIECSKKGYKYLKKEPTPLGILEEGLVSLVG